IMSYQRNNNFDYNNQGGYQDGGFPGNSWGYGAPQGQRGQYRGGRSRGQNNRGQPSNRARGSATNTFKKPAPEKVIDEVPRPQHLSRAPSEEKNDPLYSESFFTDESQREIHTGIDGLDVLSETLHGYCVSSQPGFAKRVPLSALAYYCAVYTYARMLDVHRANFRGLSYEESEFVAKVKEFENLIPKSLSTVLAGIGNTTCPNGRDLKFRLLPRNYREGEYMDVEIPGYFGMAGPTTQPLYHSYPCIAVYAQRILADIGGVQNWDLPDGIRPDDANATHPPLVAERGYKDN
ncbi:hypothetical protein J6590_108021, partial [Homalodisca vitripennis]